MSASPRMRSGVVGRIFAGISSFFGASAAGEKYTNPNGTSIQPEIDFRPASRASFNPVSQAETATVTVAVSPAAIDPAADASSRADPSQRTMSLERDTCDKLAQRSALQNPLEQIR